MTAASLADHLTTVTSQLEPPFSMLGYQQGTLTDTAKRFPLQAFPGDQSRCPVQELMISHVVEPLL